MLEIYWNCFLKKEYTISTYSLTFLPYLFSVFNYPPIVHRLFLIMYLSIMWKLFSLPNTYTHTHMQNTLPWMLNSNIYKNLLSCIIQFSLNIKYLIISHCIIHIQLNSCYHVLSMKNILGTCTLLHTLNPLHYSISMCT